VHTPCGVLSTLTPFGATAPKQPKKRGPLTPEETLERLAEQSRLIESQRRSTVDDLKGPCLYLSTTVLI